MCPVTVPSSATVAISLLSDFHIIVLSVALLGKASASYFIVLSSCTLVFEHFIEIDSTGTVFTVTTNALFSAPDALTVIVVSSSPTAVNVLSAFTRTTCGLLDVTLKAF